MAQEHLSRSLPTCVSVVLSCSCMEFNTFCTVGTTELLTSALTALSSFPDKVVVSTYKYSAVAPVFSYLRNVSRVELYLDAGL